MTPSDHHRRLGAVTPGLRAGRLHLVAVWLVSAVVLGALLVSAAARSGPLDDPDLAAQRAGMLDAVGPRSAALMVPPGLPSAGRVAVVFFVRPAQLAALTAALANDDGTRLAGAADLAVVVSGPEGASDAGVAGRVVLVADQGGRLADGYRMRRPSDGGPPVGYAVVGPDGTVRFRTEDPGVAGRLDEVLTMVRAL